MKKLFVFAFVASAAAQIRGDRMKADLTFLASPALQGRLSLAPGSEVAIEWIVAEFAKAGLKPVRQAVPLIEHRVDREASLLVITRDGRRQEYRYGAAGFTGSFPNDVTVRAPVVFAGFGITAPEFGYDDYARLDARGKIVLVFDHEPQETDLNSIFNGVGNTRHANARLKTLNAQAHGAVAVLLTPEPNRKHISNAQRSARIPGSEVRARRVPSQALAESPIRIPLLTISEAVATDVLTNPSTLQARIDTDLRPASKELEGRTAEIRLVNAERRRGTSANVIGVLEGSDPTLKNETIVFSAHYDHDGASDAGVFAGADDNGSGTVGVIELARAFASAGAPKRTLLFAVFAAEERGLLGSYYYAAHPLRPLKSTRAVINFDMIGRNEAPSRQTDGLIEIAADTSNELNLIGTVNSPQYRDLVESLNREVGLKLNYKWDRDAALNIFQRSDQFPFALHEIPAVWWFTGFHPDYHQTSDTVEKINFEKMEKIVRLAYLTGRALGEAKDTPRFVATPGK